MTELKDGYFIREYEGKGIQFLNKYRPYDNQSYYTAYSRDGETWIIEYKGMMRCKFNNLDGALNYIIEQNEKIKPRMCHN